MEEFVFPHSVGRRPKNGGASEQAGKPSSLDVSPSAEPTDLPNRQNAVLPQGGDPPVPASRTPRTRRRSNGGSAISSSPSEAEQGSGGTEALIRAAVRVWELRQGFTPSRF